MWCPHVSEKKKIYVGPTPRPHAVHLLAPWSGKEERHLCGGAIHRAHRRGGWGLGGGDSDANSDWRHAKFSISAKTWTSTGLGSVIPRLLCDSVHKATIDSSEATPRRLGSKQVAGGKREHVNPTYIFPLTYMWASHIFYFLFAD